MTNPPVPEMATRVPDCRMCEHAHTTLDTYSGLRCIYEKYTHSVYRGVCVDGSKFKHAAEPIRLYTITEEK